MSNLQVRDTVFCRFIGTESNLLEIFNAIRHTRYTDASKVMITTLAGSFYSNLKNDISFMLDALIMMLIEHQTTLNPNMPVRLLGYVDELFKRYIEPEKRKIYSTELMYVFQCQTAKNIRLVISIGMDTNLRVMADLGNLKIVLFTVGGLVCSKILSGWLAMRLTGFPNTQGLCAGLMTVPQLSATLAAAALGKTLGMLDDNFFNAIIFLSIVTTIPIPSLVRCLIQKESPSFEVTEDEAFVVPDESEGQDDVL